MALRIAVDIPLNVWRRWRQSDFLSLFHGCSFIPVKFVGVAAANNPSK